MALARGLPVTSVLTVLTASSTDCLQRTGLTNCCASIVQICSGDVSDPGAAAVEESQLHCSCRSRETMHWKRRHTALKHLEANSPITGQPMNSSLE